MSLEHFSACVYVCPYRCSVLDELGDKSGEDERKVYFRELDEDNSGAVDFEEYLTVNTKVNIFLFAFLPVDE